jgi:hypothetical protein
MFTPNASVTVSTPNGNSVSVTTDELGSYVGTMTNTEPPGTYLLTASDAAGQVATASFTVLPTASPVSFLVELISPADIYMLGAQLVSVAYFGKYTNGPVNGEFPVGSVPITSWTCKYYDPVTQSLVSIGSLPANNAAYIENVNPGGYIVTTFTSSSGNTLPIQSTVFTASAGDIWGLNPYNAVAGIIGDIYLLIKGSGVEGTATVPTLTVLDLTIRLGTDLPYILSGFSPGQVVGVSVGEYEVVLTCDAFGCYSDTFLTNSFPIGTYELLASFREGSSLNVSTLTANFTIATLVQLNITSNGNGFVDCINITTGLDVSATGTVLSGDTIQITAYPDSLYEFSGWTDPASILNSLQIMYPQVDVQANSGITLQANFVAIGGGGGGVTTPTFPAPGVVGDGQYWYYIVFQATYGGGGVWISSSAYYDEYDPDTPGSDYYELAAVYGPYDSGATS